MPPRRHPRCCRSVRSPTRTTPAHGERRHHDRASHRDRHEQRTPDGTSSPTAGNGSGTGRWTDSSATPRACRPRNPHGPDPWDPTDDGGTPAPARWAARWAGGSTTATRVLPAVGRSRPARRRHRLAQAAARLITLLVIAVLDSRAPGGCSTGTATAHPLPHRKGPSETEPAEETEEPSEETSEPTLTEEDPEDSTVPTDWPSGFPTELPTGLTALPTNLPTMPGLPGAGRRRGAPGPFSSGRPRPAGWTAARFDCTVSMSAVAIEAAPCRWCSA